MDSPTSLHLISDEHNVMSLGDITKSLEESRGGMVVTTFALDWLYYDCCDRAVPVMMSTMSRRVYQTYIPGGNKLFDFFETGFLFGLVCLNIFLERILQRRERCLRPIEGRNI